MQLSHISSNFKLQLRTLLAILIYNLNMAPQRQLSIKIQYSGDNWGTRDLPSSDQKYANWTQPRFFGLKKVIIILLSHSHLPRWRIIQSLRQLLIVCFVMKRSGGMMVNVLVSVLRGPRFVFSLDLSFFSPEQVHLLLIDHRIPFHFSKVQ